MVKHKRIARRTVALVGSVLLNLLGLVSYLPSDESMTAESLAAESAVEAQWQLTNPTGYAWHHEPVQVPLPIPTEPFRCLLDDSLVPQQIIDVDDTKQLWIAATIGRIVALPFRFSPPRSQTLSSPISPRCRRRNHLPTGDCRAKPSIR